MNTNFDDFEKDLQALRRRELPAAWLEWRKRLLGAGARAHFPDAVQAAVARVAAAEGAGGAASGEDLQLLRQGRAAGRRPFGTRPPSPGPLTAQASSQGKADQGRVTLASPCPQKLTVLAEGSTVIM
jgi:hypothetical protein